LNWFYWFDWFHWFEKMTSIKRFEDLECWKEPMVLVLKVYELTSNEKIRWRF